MYKNRIKMTILLLCVFLLTGCNVIYNLDISNNRIIESTNFYVEDDDLNIIDEDGFVSDDSFSNFEDLIDSYYTSDFNVFGYKFNDNEVYEKSKINDSNGQGVNLKYVYDFENFKYSSFFNNDPQNDSYSNDKKFIIINIKDLSSYFRSSFSSLTVNIKTNLKVLENNADSVTDNIYTWVIDENNVNEKSIYIKIKKNVNFTNFFIGFGIIAGLGLIITLLVFYIRKKNIENNSI